MFRIKELLYNCVLINNLLLLKQLFPEDWFAWQADTLTHHCTTTLNSDLQMDIHARAKGVTEALVLPLACPAVDHHALFAKLDAGVW